MAIKTFNIDDKIHKIYSEHCKKEGISMSKKVENFIKQELESIKKKSELNPSQGIEDQKRPADSFSKFCS